jgi:hypothetical protein
MYNFLPILSSNNIGDSLDTINNNYLNLDLWTQSVEASAKYLWRPILDLFISKQEDWLSASTIFQTNSSKWESLKSTVEYASAKWLPPFSLVYPEPFPESTSSTTVANAISSWVNAYFPPHNPVTDQVNFVEGQTVIIFDLYQSTTNKDKKVTLASETLCSTRDTTIKADCITYYSGYVACRGTQYNCANYSPRCPSVFNVACGYYLGSSQYGGDSPYIPVDPGNDNVVRAGIYANLLLKYNEKVETPNFNGHIFKVQGCNWVRSRGVTAAEKGVLDIPPPSLPAGVPQNLDEAATSELLFGRFILLPIGESTTWKVPAGVGKITLVAVGAGGKGGVADGMVIPGNTTNQLISNFNANNGIAKKVVLNGGSLSYQAGVVIGKDGEKSDFNIVKQVQYNNYNNWNNNHNWNNNNNWNNNRQQFYYTLQPGSPIPGIGKAGGGGASGGDTSTQLVTNGAGGGGPAWCRKTLDVTPGQVFTYTAGKFGVASTIASGNWYMSAGAGSDANGATPGRGGIPSGDYDSFRNGKPGDAPSAKAGGSGGLGYDPEGVAADYGGYIYVKFLAAPK